MIALKSKTESSKLEQRLEELLGENQDLARRNQDLEQRNEALERRWEILLRWADDPVYR
jgi:predicted RNase H-like nuclease (RuvC/YqgF family)